ncbi:hypothetical protein CK203_062795 [Vitis vinifera]|uniref:Methylcrotonoyl-CoA carboxylase subunit alpha BT domain-containing protein n=1 Tax=Vitis vinifera TaxID=29760 RepID=A0A438GB77_VITVI|nr:hypothetical protein CK203_062795 [Vitis vinifera]
MWEIGWLRTSSVRVETRVEQGDTVSMHYDLMIAKFCTLVKLALVVADDLFVDPSNLLLANEAYDATKCSAVPIAACVCEKERCNLKESPPAKAHSQYGMHTPFRVHHSASQMELSNKGEEKSLDREVKVAHLGNSDSELKLMV